MGVKLNMQCQHDNVYPLSEKLTFGQEGKREARAPARETAHRFSEGGRVLESSSIYLAPNCPSGYVVPLRNMVVNPSKAKLVGLGARGNSTNSQTNTGKISGYLKLQEGYCLYDK